MICASYNLMSEQCGCRRYKAAWGLTEMLQAVPKHRYPAFSCQGHQASSQYAADYNTITLQASQGDLLTESTVSCCENPTGAMP